MSSKGTTPVGWKRVRVGELGRWLHGSTPSKECPEFWNGDIPWISAKDLKTARISDSEDHITELAVQDGARVVPAGTLLMVVRGMILSRSFPVALTQRPATFNQDLKGLQPKAEYDPDYLLYWFQSNESRLLDLVDEASHGTKKIVTDRLYSVVVDLPATAQQQRISQVLRALDESIEASRAVIQQTRRLKIALLQDLLTNGLSRRQRKYRTAYRIGRIPADWVEVLLGDVAEITQGIAIGPERIPRNRPTPYLRVANVQQGSLDLSEIKQIEASEADEQSRSLRVNDVLMVEGHANIEDLGRAALVTKPAEGMVFQNHLFRVRTNPKKLDPRYLASWINSPPGRNYFKIFGGTTSGLNTVGSGQIRNLRLPLPEIDEQRIICNLLESIDDRVQAAETDLAQLIVVKMTLNQGLLTGRIPVSIHAAKSAAHQGTDAQKRRKE